MRPDGSGVQKLTLPAGAMPSDDGRRFAVWTRYGLEVRDRRNRRLRRVRVPLTANEGVENAIWSPDGRWLALDVLGESTDNEYVRVVVVGVAAGASNRSIGPKKGGSQVVFDSWSPRSGRFTVDVSGRLYVATVHAGRGRLVHGTSGLSVPPGRQMPGAWLSSVGAAVSTSPERALRGGSCERVREESDSRTWRSPGRRVETSSRTSTRAASISFAPMDATHEGS
jgi:hypothetical protein